LAHVLYPEKCFQLNKQNKTHQVKINFIADYVVVERNILCLMLAFGAEWQPSSCGAWQPFFLDSESLADYFS